MCTPPLDSINWLAAIVAGLAFFSFGAIWYSKALFANKWMAYAKIDPNKEDAKKGMGGIMLSALLLSIISSLGIALLRSRLDTYGLEAGLKIGLLTGLCFGATAISISYLFEKRPLGLHLINGAYTVIGHIIAAVIICLWV